MIGYRRISHSWLRNIPYAMAIKATIFKVGLQIADIDRNYYRDHALTLARHPSETDERMMVRLLAFARHAGPALSFANGLSADDEPDLWQKDLTGAIELWLDVGLPDEKSIRRACGRARRVAIYAYGGRAAELWWQQCAAKLKRIDNLSVFHVAQASSRALAALAPHSRQLHCTVQEGQIWLASPEQRVQVEIDVWLAGP